MVKIVSILIFVFMVAFYAKADLKADIIVAADGSGNYKTLTEALSHLPFFSYQRVVIYIKNGVYNEKIRLERDFITLQGESRDSTIIEYNQLREDWMKNKDLIGPAVVNIHADDIILDNLTIRNTQPEIGPHAFTIYGTGTRTIITNCNVTSKGGDTVSLWNFKNGMYYHSNCYFEGAVDFVCPRGWCYISNSTFYELKNTAAIWHAAPHNPNQKFVLENCEFAGVDSFYLARHHYDAQFFFVDCHFSESMKNQPVKHVVYPKNPEKDRPYLYNDRYYFYNCVRTHKNYQWFKNNLNKAGVEVNEITPEWTFDGQWNPEDTSALKITKLEVEGNKLYLWFDEPVMPQEKLTVKLSTGKMVHYHAGCGWRRLELIGEEDLNEKDIQGEIKVINGNIKNIEATVSPRYLKNHATN